MKSDNYEKTTEEWIQHIGMTYGYTKKTVEILNDLETDTANTIQTINQTCILIRTILEEITIIRDTWNDADKHSFNNTIHFNAALDPILFGGHAASTTTEEWQEYIKGFHQKLIEIIYYLNFNHLQKNTHTFPHIFTHFDKNWQLTDMKKRVLTHMICADFSMEELFVLMPKERIQQLPGIKDFFKKTYTLSMEESQ